MLALAVKLGTKMKDFKYASNAGRTAARGRRSFR